MKVLFTEYIKPDAMGAVQSKIDAAKFSGKVEQDPEKVSDTGYGIKYDKIVIADGCLLKMRDLKKFLDKMSGSWVTGNGITSGAIDDLPVSWIVFAKGADLSPQNIDTIVQIIRKENLKV